MVPINVIQQFDSIIFASNLYIVMVNALKRLFKPLGFYFSFIAPGHTKKYDLILTNPLCEFCCIKHCAI